MTTPIAGPLRHAISSIAGAAVLSVSAAAFAQAPQGPAASPADAPATGQPPPPAPYGAPPAPYGAPPAPYGAPPAPYYGPPAYPIEDWEQGDPVPPGYQPDSRIRKGLVLGGVITTGALWVVSAAAGVVLAASDSFCIFCTQAEEDELAREARAKWFPLFIPLAGPFVTIATAEPGAGGTAILLVDGVGQVGGMALMIVGLVAQEDYLKPAVRTGQLEVRPAPIVTRDFRGMGLVGSF